MPAATCTRCFAVFQSDDARPGIAPLCPRCAAVPAKSPSIRADLEAEPAPARRSFPLRRAAIAVAALACAAALVAGAVAAVKALAPRLGGSPSPRSTAPTPAQEAVAAWRRAGLLPAVAPAGEPTAAAVDERLAEGRAALVADRGRAEEAKRAFREALALAPDSTEAVAGYALALAEGGLDGVEGEELARAHALLGEAQARRGGDPHLLAAYARLLLAVPSPRNLAEARGVAKRALAAAPADPDAALASGLVEARTDPAAGARALSAAAVRSPGDRRLLSAAARASWEAGDAVAALALASARLGQDPDHAGALALTAEVLIATDRAEDARPVLARWAEGHPEAAEPLLLEAILAYQADRDVAAARRLLANAMARNPDDFLAARILAHRAAVEREGGDPAAARAAVADGLRRVPASAPLQYQAALLAYEARDAAAFREAAGTVGDRAGALAAADLSARALELRGELGDAQAAYLALADRVSNDPRALLEVAGALARMRAPGPALEVAQRALRRDLADARLSRVPTEFWRGTGELSAAAQRLREIARIEVRVPGSALSAAAACELLLGHLRDAEELARAASAAEPQAPAGRWLQAQVALELAQPARALPLARSAVDADESDVPSLATLARALEASSRLEDAVRTYRRAVAAGPDLVAARLALARLLARRGDAAAGRTLLAALRRDAPRVPAVQRAVLDLGPAAPAVP